MKSLIDINNQRLYLIFILLTMTFSSDISGQIDKINSISISDSSINIDNKFLIDLPVSLDSLSKHLGNPRVDVGSPNSIYFWDNLGIMGFVPNNTSSITSFEICMSESNFSQTTKFYQGSIIILASIIDSKMTKSEFSNINLTKDVNDYMPEVIIGKTSIIVEFDKKTNKIIGIGITKKK